MKLLASLVTLGFCFVAACGSDDDNGGGSSGSTSGATPNADAGPATGCTADLAPAETKQGACTVTISSPGLQQPASKHVPAPTALAFCSNPPSSGPHYPQWADFREYTQETEWGYLVHSMEHGGVVLLYNCPAGCPDVVEGLRAVRDRAAADPTCEAQGRAGVKRIIIAPSKSIPTKVAAAAWAATYTADCIDGPSLDEFVRTKSQIGPENLCFVGQITP